MNDQDINRLNYEKIKKLCKTAEESLKNAPHERLAFSSNIPEIWTGNGVPVRSGLKAKR